MVPSPMTSSLLTPASAMTALKNLTAAAQGVRGGAAVAGPPVAPPTAGLAPTPPAQPQTYATSRSEAMTSGVGALVHADMNVAAARLRALQAQKLLGAQAVSIANQHSQLVQKLFGG